MKQLLILSGKGGTGKTTIAGAFIKLSLANAFADCDVDAPNLHIILNQKFKAKQNDFLGLKKARIKQELCIKCGKCQENCRFNAISYDKIYRIDYYSCEGCSLCQEICPVNAITMDDAVAGNLLLYKENKAIFSTAKLKMGSGTSGLLVSEVKSQLKEYSNNYKYAIIDGSPGIGCPVIASLSGAYMVLLVAEPSVSGLSDMKRIIITARKFNVEIVVCINKYNNNLKITRKIVAFCKKENIIVVGRIPYDSNAVNAINNNKTIVEIDSPAAEAIKLVYEKTMNIFFRKMEEKDDC